MRKKLSGWKQNIKKNVPEIIVLLLCLGLLGTGVCRKQGYHMDELLSFELANARFTPWIVPTQPEGRLEKFVKNEIEGDSFGETLGNLKGTVEDVLQNRGSSKMLSYKADVYEEPVWISAEQFLDYITVGERDAFNYLSVYFNVKDDNHPPLHFMLLHTMSSFFKGQISPMLGCSINLVAMAGILVLLMGLGRRFGKELGQEEEMRFLGMMAALSFGLSAGAMAATLLIRMYALLMFFCVALFYIHVKKWQEDGFGRYNKLLVFVTVCGFWTQYFFLFYCLVLAAVTAVLLLRRKKYRELARYAGSMAFAGVIGIVGFPFAISDVFSSGRGVEALDNLSKGLSGYGERMLTFARILADRTYGGLFWCLLFLFIWFVIEWAICVAGRKKRQDGGNKQGSDRKKTGEPLSPLLWMLVLPAAGYFLMAARMSPYLVDRYMMPLFPFVSLGGILLVAGLINSHFLLGQYRRQTSDRQGYQQGRKQILRPHYFAWAVWGLLLIGQVIGFFQYDGTYLYTGYATQKQMAEENASYPCICVYDGVGYYENLVEFTSYEKTLLVKQEELAGRKDRESITSMDKVVVLVKPGVDLKETMRIMEEIYGFSLEKWLWRGAGVHGDVAGIFGKSH